MKRVSWLQTVLLLGLLLGQLAQLVHASDVDAHTGDEPCEACMVLAGLDAGPARHETGMPVAGLHEQNTGIALTIARDSRAARFHSRAPPAASLTS